MPNAYEDFSRYYDFLGWNAFARNAAVRLKSFFRLQRSKSDGSAGPATILDLACGTGELEKSLKSSGIRFTGIDSSPGMIRQARRKCPGTRFIVADAAGVRLERKFRMAILLFDSANHMRSLPHLKSVFRNVRRHLKPGGYFIFDFLTERGLEEWEHINIKRTGRYTLFSYGYYYPEKMLADIFIEAFIRIPGKPGKSGGYHRVFQKIIEKTYPASDIIDGLMKSGFQKISATPYDLSEKIEEATRLWFVCS